MNNKDESSPYRVLLISTTCIVILSLCYFIPEYSLNNEISLKKIDIFHDIREIKTVLVKPKKEIKKERRCIQVNYVTFPTDWKVY